MVPDGHEDLSQLLIGEMGWEGRHGLDEVEELDPGVGSPGRWYDHQNGSRSEPTNLVAATAVGFGEPLTQLPHDGDPDFCVEGNLVANADSLETGRPLHRVLLAEKAGVEISDTTRSLNGIELNVQEGWARGPAPHRVSHVHHVEAEIDLVDPQHKLKCVPHLPLGGDLPITAIKV